MAVNKGYNAFIKEAFINPIRSVLIVDDDYPTYSEMFELQKSRITPGKDETPSSKAWRKDPDKIRKVINSFRKPELSLLVDVHDGGDGTEADIAYHLHQSDLLVLDFNLGASGDGGSKSVDIARRVMANDHFNLVVVHTSTDLEEAFRQILLGLMPPCCDEKTAEERKAAQTLIEKYELDKGPIVDRIKSAFSVEQYLPARQNIAAALSAMFQGTPPFAAFTAICKEAGWKGTATKQVFFWAMHLFEHDNKKKMDSRENKLRLQWSEPDKWIRSHSGFFAFAQRPMTISTFWTNFGDRS